MIDRGAVVLDGSTSVIGATGEPFVRRGTDAAVRVTTARVDLDGCVRGVVGATGASLAFAVHDGTDAVVVGDGCGVVVSGGDGRVSERTVSFVRGAACTCRGLPADTQRSASPGTASRASRATTPSRMVRDAA